MVLIEFDTTREMEMRAGNDIEVGRDLTPPLSPLSSALHDSFLFSHCSSCFSSLPSPPHPSSHSLLLFCSPLCSSSSSVVELRLLRLLNSRPSLYPHSSTSVLRAALRLLTLLPFSLSPRISGLLTNRSNLISHDDDVTIRRGAHAMFLARTIGDEDDAVLDDAVVCLEDEAGLEEAALCLVLTNAVEVVESSGRSLGIAVYDTRFSWINHSCSPNSCYRFLVSSPQKTLEKQCVQVPLLIVAADEVESGVCSDDLLKKECEKFGPRVIVRSIKRISKGEQVTITYTDLLQPKAMRQSELWSRYLFMCSCVRCSASPLSYIDCALEDISAVNFNSYRFSSDISFNRDKATKRLTEYIDDAIDDYLSIDNPGSCCEKLEQVLTGGLSDNHPEGIEKLTYRLNPLHHLSLNAYTTLASAYKILADDLLTMSSDIDNHVTRAFYMRRTSTAYSLLLAGAAHHLSNYESSLVVCLANFWTTTGDSLLHFAKSTLWSEVVRCDLPVSGNLELYCKAKYKCPRCSLVDKLGAFSLHDPVTHEEFERSSREFIHCITNLTQKVWCYLGQGCRYLELCKNPIDFAWLDTSECSSEDEGFAHIFGSEAEGNISLIRMYILQLGVHCLLYGEYLGKTCYARYSHWVCCVHNILDCEGKL